MQRIQYIARSIMIAVLLCAGGYNCVNAPALNAQKVAGWNMAIGGYSAALRQSGWAFIQRGITMPSKSVAYAALCLEKSRRNVRK